MSYTSTGQVAALLYRSLGFYSHDFIVIMSYDLITANMDPHKVIPKCPLCVTDVLVLMVLPHFDVFCDQLLNRCMATWNLFVL